MNKPESPADPPGNKRHVPAWVTPIYLALLFLLIHITLPWALSLLGRRYGWMDGRPGVWNLLALILVTGGIAGTLWMIALHYLTSPGAFMNRQPTQDIVRRGPYAYTRNPMYLFELTFWLGWALFYGSLAVGIGFLAWLSAFNFIILPWEERGLEERFGEPYREYKRRVPRWFGRRER